MPVVWATAHMTQFAKVGWKYLAVGKGSGLLPSGGYYTTIVDPKGDDFALHVVKNSLDHASCTRPNLPDTETVADEVITVRLDRTMLGATPGVGNGYGNGYGNAYADRKVKLACWRSNFEAETPILFEQQPDIVLTAGVATDVDVNGAGAGSVAFMFKLKVIKGDLYTISTVRTAKHGRFSEPVPPSQPRAPLPIYNDMESTPTSQQPGLFMQMTGAWEVQADVSNSSNKVMRQMATQIPLDNWPGRFAFMPATVIGMREWQDVSIGASFRLPTSGGAPNWPASGAGACVGTRLGWVYECGVVLCIDASGQWNMTYAYVHLVAQVHLGSPLLLYSLPRR
jgi:galactosylceramidase